jgi:hypothetical protein
MRPVGDHRKAEAVAGVDVVVVVDVREVAEG